MVEVTMRPIHSIPLLLSAAAILATACSEDLTMEEITETEISTSGGSALSFDGQFEALFPPNAVRETVRVTVQTIRPTAGSNLVSLIYALGPRSVELAQPVQIRFRSSTDARIVRLEDDGTTTMLPSSIVGDEIIAGVQTMAAYALASTPTVDAGLADAGVPAQDASVQPDTGPSPVDAGILDASPPADTGPSITDAGTDAGFAIDVGPADTGVTDAGPSSTDAGNTSDAGTTPVTLATCGMSPTPEIEPNDTRGTAQAYSGGVLTPLQGTFTSTTDVDWYVLSSPRRTVVITTHAQLGAPLGCGGLDTILTVTDATGAVIASNDNFNATTCSQVVLTNLSSLTDLYIRVQVRGGTIAPYVLTMVQESTTQPPLPDLVMTAIVGNPTWPRGGSHQVALCVENRGTATATPMTSRVFLSTNALIRLTDTPLIDVAASSIGPGGVRADAVQVTIPSSIPTGPFFVGAIADIFSQVAERSKSNNVSAAVPITIVP